MTTKQHIPQPGYGSGLRALEDKGTITAYRIAEDEVIVTVPVGYLDDDSTYGYDPTTVAAQATIDAALAVHGLHFADAGIEEDGSGEYWIYRP